MPESKKTYIKNSSASVQKWHICFQEPRIQCLVRLALFARPNKILHRRVAKLKQMYQQKTNNRRDCTSWLDLY
jgi:hypothetical protein